VNCLRCRRFKGDPPIEIGEFEFLKAPDSLYTANPPIYPAIDRMMRDEYV